MSVFSSQHHSFDIKLARLYGVDEAIMIHHFLHWIRINRLKNHNIRDGRCWTYQSRKDIKSVFPYWTFEQVKYLCEKLVQRGILVTGNYNKSPTNRTLWYAFADEKLFGIDENSINVYERENSLMERENSLMEKGKFPDVYKDTDTITTDTKTQIREREEDKPPPPPPVSFFSHEKVKMPQQKYDSLVKEYGKERVIDMVDDLNTYSGKSPKDFARYSCHADVIRSWIKREDKEKKKAESVSKHHGFTTDNTPRDPRKTIDFSEEA